ncbi:hypothetical protein RJ55_03598 [Drechmeria coniospora]|nr:hypothetical protein RJ55_03598 [Drechmeria coniospora]
MAIMASLVATALLLFFARIASCVPAISFPFNAQLPSVARIDKSFSYSFSPYTFTSSSKMTYALGTHPSWLSIESGTRRLYGTPKDSAVDAGDVVGQPVDIIATDDTGSTTMSATIVVSRLSPPSVKVPMQSQIASFGKFSAPSSILANPSTPFTYTFSRGTFGTPEPNYYASSGNSSPLPAWIRFDAASLTFSGTTPPVESLVQPPQTFDFRLVASDVVGFSAASLSFSIVVGSNGSHTLTTDKPVIALNASRQTELAYDGVLNGVKLDGKQVVAAELNATTDGLPSWLAYDAQIGKLQGTPGPDDHSTNFTISFQDKFSDKLDVLVVLQVSSALFESTLDDIKVRPGSDFEVDLAKHFRNPNDVDIQVTSDPEQDWLKVDGLQLSGKVPDSAKDNFTITITASSKSSAVKETAGFGVIFLELEEATPTVTVAASTAVAKATQTQTSPVAESATDSHSGRLSTAQILLATIIPIIFITFLLILLACFFRRRRARQTYLSGKYRKNMPDSVPANLGAADSDHSVMSQVHVMKGGVGVHTERQLFRPGKEGYADGISPSSSRERSSVTLGSLSDPEMPRPLFAEAPGTITIRSIDQSESEVDRQSWVTVEVEGTATTVTGSNGSNTTFPGSPHQMLPMPRYLTESRTMSTLGDVSNFQPTPTIIPRKEKQSLGTHSIVTSSSAALPRGFESGQRKPVPEQGSTANWETIAESDAGGSVSVIRKPSKALLTSRTEDSKGWYDTDSSAESKDFETDMSFGSAENWRVIGSFRGVGTARQSASHKDLVHETPYRASRPGTGRTESDRPEALSPSTWRETGRSTGAQGERSMSSVPKHVMDEDQDEDADDGEAIINMSGGNGEPEPATHRTGWSREHSHHQRSDAGGSFSVFL